MDWQGDLKITPEQFYEGIKRQYTPGLEAIKSDEELRSTVRRFGVDPDEMAKEIEAELKQLEALTFKKTV